MKIEKIKLETIDRIETMSIKHKDIKLVIYPKKLKFDEDADYGDEVFSTKYNSYISDCEYDDDDIPYLIRLLNLKKYINNNNCYDAFKAIVVFLRRNSSEYKLTITPFPDDISDKRAKEMRKFVKKLV